MTQQRPDVNLALRRAMVAEQIRARGLDDPRVLAAMEEIPRERFVPEVDRGLAFSDRALAIDCGQTISQPFVVAAMTSAAAPQPHHRVLEIGTGSGYQTAVLARLAGQVYTIERIAQLSQAAESLLNDLGITNVSYRIGDGSLGWIEAAPFDRIVVTAGAPSVPRSLRDQLANGGRLVIPVGDQESQVLTVIEREGAALRESPRFGCRFVKLIGQEGWAE